MTNWSQRSAACVNALCQKRERQGNGCIFVSVMNAYACTRCWCGSGFNQVCYFIEIIYIYRDTVWEISHNCNQNVGGICSSSCDVKVSLNVPTPWVLTCSALSLCQIWRREYDFLQSNRGVLELFI